MLGFSVCGALAVSCQQGEDSVSNRSFEESKIALVTPFQRDESTPFQKPSDAELQEKLTSIHPLVS